MNNFSTPVIVKYMEKNLDITKPCYREHIFVSPQFFSLFRYIEVPPYVLSLPGFVFFLYSIHFGVTESIVFICTENREAKISQVK